MLLTTFQTATNGDVNTLSYVNNGGFLYMPKHNSMELY